MKKKIALKTLAIAVILVGVILLGFTAQGIIEGNKIYDLFRKIRVNVHDVYKDVDSKGLEQVKEEYRDVFAAVDQIDALGGEKAKTYLNNVNTAYGLVDTIEATESIVGSINRMGAQQAQQSLAEVFDTIDEAGKALSAVKAAGAENAETYLVDVEAALADHEDLDEARAQLDAGYSDLDEDTAKQVKAFFNFVFQMAKDKGSEEALRYMEAVIESADVTAEEFAEQRIAERYADPELENAEQLRQYSGDVFRLISDQGTAQAKTYIQQLLKTMEQKDIPDARAYLDEVYEDNDDNRVTRKYLDAIFQTIDAQGMEYAKLHGGDICAVVGQEDVEQAQTFLDALNAAPAGDAGASLEKLSQFRAAIEAAGKGFDGSANPYLSGLYAVNAEVDKAVSAAERAQKKADKSAAAIDTAREKAEAAKAAVAAAATEEEKAAAAEEADAAQKAYDTAVAKAQKDREDADKKQLDEEKARQYMARMEEALDQAKSGVTPESLDRVKKFQDDVCALMSKVGMEKAKKYMENACKAYSDKTLRITRLGDDNAQKLEDLDDTKLSRTRNKARLMMLTLACLIIGVVLLCIKVNENAQPRLTREERAQMGRHMGLKTSRMIANSAIHAVLIIISVVWLIPFISIVLQSLRVESTHQVGYIMPDKLHFYNYADLFGTDFPRWYANTFIMALIVALLQTVIVLCMSYTLSRFRFKMRKPLMRFMLILGMFPGMLTMIILYRVLSDLGLTQEHAVPGLILVYIASSGMGYYVSKGFFDTIPKSLDEAARVDGATRFQVLKKIILPLSKPIVIYTILTAFMGPWGDYVFARYISFGKSVGMNVAVGLYSWLSKDQIASRYTMFCAGGVLVAIPVAVLFMCLQKYYVEGVTGGAVKG